MKNPIYLFIGIIILIHLLEQFFLLWKPKLRPTLLKHFFLAERNVATPENTSTWWTGITAAVQIYFCTLKSLAQALQRYIDVSLRTSPFLHRNFPAIMRHFPVNRNSEI